MATRALNKILRMGLVMAMAGSLGSLPAAEGSVEASPAVQMFVPGFTVRELPIQISNQNNVEYAADGRLFAAGYDGVLQVLQDTDGDGLEDKVTKFGEQPDGDYPLGIAVRGDSVYVLFRNEVARFRDTDGDGIPDKREVAIRDWEDEATKAQTMFIKRRVDYGLGLAIAPDGNFFISVGNAAFNKAYLLDKDGKSQYSPKFFKGSVLKISPDGSKVEQIATGVRYVMSLQFNRHGDLLASEQEGATWLPNGNPFDELLHIQPGRHYGFPPRHPVHLPNVIDEPSVFDYGPEHQSICSFRFNESGPNRARFGPPSWEGDAFLTGESRGKLYRTKLVKTPAGYVAQNHLIASLPGLAVDCTFSPKGDLLVAAHTGKPDWGTGPKGIGRIFKISYQDSGPFPLLAYPANASESRVEFDRPLDLAKWKNAASQTVVESGRYVGAGDRFETFRPGYAVVQMQQKEARKSNRVNQGFGAAGRTLFLPTGPKEAVNYAVSLPAREVAIAKPGAPVQASTIELAHDLSGVVAEWRPKNSTTPAWTGWLPHPDLQVSRELTKGSARHEELFAKLKEPGALRLRGQLDLSLMLRAATQPLGKLDYEYPPETVSVVFASATPLRLKTSDLAKIQQPDSKSARLDATTSRNTGWVMFDLSVDTGPEETAMAVHWFTAEDSRPRALPLRRTLVTWARPIGTAPEAQIIPEIAGGNWSEGRKLFFSEQVACSKCHNLRGEGGAVGPDLSNLVHRDYASVMKDITQPSAALNPDSLAYAIELKDGESVTGVIAGDDGKELTVADATGKATKIAKTKIASTKPSAISLMPEGLLNSLSKEQVRDLMTFLLTEEKK